MNDPLLTATLALADMLATENRALAALDIRAAAMLLDDKRRAADAFTRAHALGPAASGAALTQAAARLQAVAQENRRLLERAIDVQGRVIEIVVRAIPRAAARGQGRYNAKGGLRAAHVAAMNLSARA